MNVEIVVAYPIACLNSYVDQEVGDLRLRQLSSKYKIDKDSISNIIKSEHLQIFFEKYINNLEFLSKFDIKEEIDFKNKDSVKNLINKPNFEKELNEKIKKISNQKIKELKEYNFIPSTHETAKITILGLPIIKKDRMIDGYTGPERKEVIIGRLNSSNIIHEIWHTVPIEKQDKIKELFLSILNQFRSLLGYEPVISNENINELTKTTFNEIKDEINKNNSNIKNEKIFKNNIDDIFNTLGIDRIKNTTNKDIFKKIQGLKKDDYKKYKQIKQSLSEEGKKEFYKYKIIQKIEIAEKSVYDLYKSEQHNDEMRSRLSELYKLLKKNEKLLPELYHKAKERVASNKSIETLASAGAMTAKE